MRQPEVVGGPTRVVEGVALRLRAFGPRLQGPGGRAGGRWRHSALSPGTVRTKPDGNVKCQKG